MDIGSDTATIRVRGVSETKYFADELVSYRDASQPQADLGEGRIQALVTSWAASSSPVQTGKARYLAVINPTRAAVLPDLPTVRELGYPGT